MNIYLTCDGSVDFILRFIRKKMEINIYNATHDMFFRFSL